MSGPMASLKRGFTDGRRPGGRTGRADFVWMGVCYCVLVAVSGFMARDAAGLGDAGGALFAGVCLLAVVHGLVLHVRRLHDRGRSGWWLLLLAALQTLAGAAGSAMGASGPAPLWASCAVEIASSAVAVAGMALLLGPGEPAANRWGPAPAGTPAWSLTFTEGAGLCLRRLCRLEGRSPRAEFWWGSLALSPLLSLVASLATGFAVLSGVDAMDSAFLEGLLVAGGAGGVLLLPLGVRRCHDLNLSGWVCAALTVIPCVLVWGFHAAGGSAGAGLPALQSAGLFATHLVWLVIAARPGTRGPNRFGIDPNTAEGFAEMGVARSAAGDGFSFTRDRLD